MHYSKQQHLLPPGPHNRTFRRQASSLNPVRGFRQSLEPNDFEKESSCWSFFFFFRLNIVIVIQYVIITWTFSVFVEQIQAIRESVLYYNKQGQFIV